MLHENSFIAQTPNFVRALLSVDPAYAAWSEQRQSDNERHFDDWLASPDGQAWLDSECEIDAERRCISPWEGW
jgi:hypothetical protein